MYRALSVALPLLAATHALLAASPSAPPSLFQAAVFLVKTPASLLVALNLLVLGVITVASFGRRVFFGTLRQIEREHLNERAWFAVTETLIAMTVFRDDFDIGFVFLFAVLLLVKCAHWVSGDRVDHVCYCCCYCHCQCQWC